MNDASDVINIYSDESSHTNNGNGLMLLGAIWTTPESAKLLSGQVKLVKIKHDTSIRREIKWTKVSPSKLDYYKDLLDLFIDNDQINYRSVIVDKSKLDHAVHNHTHEDFYYILQYNLIRNIASKRVGHFKIYLDYKDSWSNSRCQELVRYLSNTGNIVGHFNAQAVRSHEVTAIQLADLITGIVSYANKPEEQQKSSAKTELVSYLQDKIGQKFNITTPYDVEKFNLFFWSKY